MSIFIMSNSGVPYGSFWGSYFAPGWVNFLFRNFWNALAYKEMFTRPLSRFNIYRFNGNTPNSTKLRISMLWSDVVADRYFTISSKIPLFILGRQYYRPKG